MLSLENKCGGGCIWTNTVWWLHFDKYNVVAAFGKWKESATNATTVPRMQLTAFEEDYCGAI